MSRPIPLGGRTFRPLFADRFRALTPAEDAALGAGIRAHGVLVAVVVDDGDGVIDGANRLAKAAEAGVPIDRIPLDLRRGLTAEEKYALACELNDSRRQQTAEEIQARRAERVGRVAAKRREGKSLRAIAEEEGVSHQQVKRDLDESTVTGVTVEPEDGKVISRDGRKRPAKGPRKPKAEANGESTGPGGPVDSDADSASAEVLTDEAGADVPERALAAFRQLPELRQLLRTLDAAAREVERLGRSAVGGQCHWQSAQAQIKNARRTMHAGRPAHACPYCKGRRDDCDGCRGKGFVTAAAYDQAPKEAKA